MSENGKRERFGRYLILDHLVDGGMAKICRARFLGEQADKVVAIKMVQPQFSKDEGFKTMFMDEIKVTFGLIHPNIVQTYDYGLHKGQLFVAMEYCDGRNLKQYLDKLRERKFVFPVEISTYIISQACQGLYYAHTFRDKLTGQEANIIHRDISPHNIMLTFDGAVKIIDFGIAKSQKNSDATQAGTIKGKLSYLAPEYLEGMELDTRYDQFSLGITLWELLCSRKLFKENNDLAVLKKIQECKIPAPSSINPNVPKELDEIVLKALSKDRNKRYDNLDQMNRALMKFLYSKYSDFNATDLSYFAQELFKDEIKLDRQKLFEFGKIDIRPFLNELREEAERGTKRDRTQAPAQSHASKSDQVALEDEESSSFSLKKEKVLDFGFEEKSKSSLGINKLTVSAVKKKPIANSSSSNHIKKETSYTREMLGKSKPGELTKANLKRNSTKIGRYSTKIDETSRIKGKDDEDQSSSPLTKMIAGLVVVAAGAYYYLNYQHASNDKAVIAKERFPAQSVEVERSNEYAGVTKLTLTQYNRQKMKVYIDGVMVQPNLVGTIDVPINRLVTLRVEIADRQHFIQELNFTNTSPVMIEIPNMPQAFYSYLVTRNCSTHGEIKYTIYNEKRISQIPLSSSIGIPFPLNIEGDKVVETNVDIFFKKQGQKIEKKVTIKFLRIDQSINLCEYI